MASTDDRYDRLIHMISLARGLEMGGFYNAAKLLWAAAYSAELRASDQMGIPKSSGALAEELGSIIAVLQAAGTSDELRAALERSRDVVAHNRTVAASDVAEVHVCRTCGEIVLGAAPEACPNCGAWELTFKTFPAVYYLEPLPPEQALAALTSAPGLVERLIHRLSPEQMDLRPSEDEWAVRDVLRHLWISQELLAGRVSLMLAEEDPVLHAMGVAEMTDSGDLAAGEILDKFRTSRAATVAALRAASPNGWWRTGRHEEFGRVTVLQQASYFAKHDHNHLTQIRQIVAATVR
jgi:DinB superfamily